MQIYEPAEDSHLFQKFLKKTLIPQAKRPNSNYPSSTASPKLLDMGTGSGILAKTAAKILGNENVTAADINPKAIAITKKSGIKSIKSNLFSNIKQKFDIIIFNAPYLPLDPREPKDSQTATTGGKRGDEISIKFLRQAKKHLNKNGKIYLLISSLTPMGQIKKFKHKIVARKKIFMEELLILEFNS